MSLYEAAKDAVKVAQKADNIELVQKIMDIQKEALDMQEKLQAKNEEIEEFKKIIRSLEEKITSKDNYKLEKGVYWKVDDGDYNQPFCPACYSKGSILPMHKAWAGKDKTQTPWTCSDKSCGARANPWDYKSPTQFQARY